MYKHILIPTDGSALSEKAVESGVNLAKQLAAKVTSVFVWVRLDVVYPDLGLGYAAPLLVDDADLQIQTATTAQAHFCALAKAAGLPYDTSIVSHQDPAQGIIQVAQDQHCDLIFMASHGRRGVKAMLLGSVTHAVLAHCHIPVLVFR